MNKWTMPKYYYGETWYDYYVAPCTQNRDSDCLERSNFKECLKMLGGEKTNDADVPMVIVVRENHFLCGWVEWIAIHETNIKGIEIAKEIERKLENYPILNEDSFSEMEWNEACKFWEGMSISERVELCQRFDINVFSARHDCIPESDNGSLFEYLVR